MMREVVNVALTAKQQRFVEEYLIDLNATQAAKRAGYKNAEIGRQLITKNNVSGAIQEALKKRSSRTEITQDQVLEELAKVGFKKAADYTDAELKYGNKIRALELIGKHLGMFNDKQPNSNNSEDDNLYDAIEKAVNKALDTGGES